MKLYCPYCGQETECESDMGHHEFMGRQRQFKLVLCSNLECGAVTEIIEDKKPCFKKMRDIFNF